MRTPSRHQRQRLLAEVFEQGIRHFDVARMYGLGVAEDELGRFARGRRDQILIATKFGIDPAGSAGRLARLQAPARAALGRVPALRAAVKRRQSAFHQPRRYDAARACTSLETSLKALGTDYVDILFVHDPEPGDRAEMAELVESLEGLRQSGRIRAWGFAGNPEPCIGLRDAAEVDVVLQIRDEILDSPLRRIEPDQALITFGVLSQSLGRVLSHVSASNQQRSSWSEAVGRDCGRADVVASLLLQDALDRNSAGTVLFSTTRAGRVQIALDAVATLASEPEPSELRAFRRRVLAELGHGR